MKNWNISSLKFVSEMYNGLSAFFGMNAEETTEAELHQKLIEAGTLENIKSAALNEANAAVMTQMATFQTTLDGMQTQLNDLQADAQSKGEKVAELETELETVKGQLTEKDGEIETHLSQIKGLSGEVATLKAGKPIDKNAPPDQSKPIEQAKAPNGGVVVSNEQFMRAFDAVSN